MAPETPNVIISACLLGREVRYDGGHKYARTLVEALSLRVRWLAVCPEVEIGLGVPRPTIDLYGDPANPALRQAGSGEDLTQRMQAWIESYLDSLAVTRIHGAILKARSPSCGIDKALLYPAPGAEPIRQGRGLFAAALLARYPDIPIVNEDALQTEKEVQEFLSRMA